jgi:hypothetical protein
MTQNPIGWSDFAIAAPALAAPAQDLLQRYGFVYLGTIRSDGTPRISAVETHLVQQHLMLVMVAGTQKARDVRRDPRLVVQTPVTDPHDPGEELKLRGVALTVDADLRAATTATIEDASGWRPQPSWLFLEVGVQAAALLSWNPETGDMLLTRWDHNHGFRGPETRHLDMQASQYRRREG